MPGEQLAYLLFWLFFSLDEAPMLWLFCLFEWTLCICLMLNLLCVFESPCTIDFFRMVFYSLIDERFLLDCVLIRWFMRFILFYY